MKFAITGALLDIRPSSALGRDLARDFALSARQSVQELQRERRAPKLYRRTVGGQFDQAEALPVLPGPINYRFDWIREATQFALDELIRLSPVRTGRYRRSFLVVANGRAMDPREIPAGAEVDIVNTQPYSRKIQVGAAGFTAFRDLFEKAKRSVKREYAGLANARVTFKNLDGGYLLKTSAAARPAAATRRSSAFRAGRATLSRRADRQAGAALTYPVLMVWPTDEIAV